MATRTKTHHYLRLNGKYLKDAEDLLDVGDYSQASEKFWGAAAEIVKAVASKKGRRLKTHNDLWGFVIDIHRENQELGLASDFSAASHLHSNFYEDELNSEIVGVLGESVKSFVKKMQQFL